MNKVYYLTIGFILILLNASGQRQNLYFLKNNGTYVKLRDSADYLRIVMEPEQGSDLYAVNEYFLDGSDKSKGYSSKIDPPLYEGQYISYFRNGKKKRIANYTKGALIGTVISYYPNGSLYSEVVYATEPSKEEPYVKSVNDSLGKGLVVDGNGTYIVYAADFEYVIESGSIKNGLRDGIWTGGGKSGDIKFTETYADGKLVSGESIDRLGNSYLYTKAYVQPEFKGGITNFYKYIKKTVKYPSECYKAGIDGKVYLNFIIRKNGEIDNVKVMRSPHALLSKEALRVMKASPAWEPGFYRGIISDISFNMPIAFSLR